MSGTAGAGTCPQQVPPATNAAKPARQIPKRKADDAARCCPAARMKERCPCPQTAPTDCPNRSDPTLLTSQRGCLHPTPLPSSKTPPEAARAGGETSFPNPTPVTAQSVSSQTQNESVLHPQLTQNSSRSTERFAGGAPWNPVAPVGTGDWDRRKQGQEEEPESPGDHRTGPWRARASDSSRSGRPGSTGSGNRNVVTGGLARHPGSFGCSGQPKRQRINAPQMAFPQENLFLTH